MKFRDYKTFAPDNVYHIYNRGDNKEKIFLDEEDHLNFLKKIKICLGLQDKGLSKINPIPKGNFKVFSYCLMDNHFHLVIKQCQQIPISLLMKKICTSYAMYYNSKYSRIGNVFQDIYKAKLIENDEYLVYLTAYIHNNPDNPLTYSYSSFHEYLNLTPDICDTESVLQLFKNDAKKYKKFVLECGRKPSIINDLVFDD